MVAWPPVPAAPPPPPPPAALWLSRWWRRDTRTRTSWTSSRKRKSWRLESVFRIRIRKVLGLPDPDLLVRGVVRKPLISSVLWRFMTFHLWKMTITNKQKQFFVGPTKNVGIWHYRRGSQGWRNYEGQIFFFLFIQRKVLWIRNDLRYSGSGYESCKSGLGPCQGSRNHEGQNFTSLAHCKFKAREQIVSGLGSYGNKYDQNCGPC